MTFPALCPFTHSVICQHSSASVCSSGWGWGPCWWEPSLAQMVSMGWQHSPHCQGQPADTRGSSGLSTGSCTALPGAALRLRSPRWPCRVLRAVMSILLQGEALLWVSFSVVPVLGSFQETLLFLLWKLLSGGCVSVGFGMLPQKSDGGSRGPPHSPGTF